MKTLEDYLIETMKTHFDTNTPQVGIFWYNVRKNELFGIRKQTIEETFDFKHKRNYITGDELHKNVWKKELNKQKFKNNSEGPFKGDWKDTERGRIFYDSVNDVWQICVGSWIREHDNVIDLIVDEFHLNEVDYSVEIMSHWEIGQGWGD